MLAPDLVESLRRVADVMRVARCDWWVISSAAVALHGGSPIDVGDVDVLATRDDARRVLDALGIEPVTGTGTDLFRSDVFGRWTVPPLAIEIMGGFHVRGVEVWPRTREAVRVDNGMLHIPARAELAAIVASFGRAKDADRVALLDAVGRQSPG